MEDLLGDGPVAPPAPPPPPPPSIRPAIQVRGPARGFWRAGHHFGPDWTTIPLDELTEAQLVAIRAEPRLATRPTVVLPAQGG